MEDKTFVAGAFTAGLDLTLADGGNQSLDLIQDELLVGRGQDCGLVLSDERVSRRHALLKREVATYVIEDLGSSNGVLVNGERVRRHALADGDVITLGGSQLVYVQAAAQPANGTMVRDAPDPSHTQTPRPPKAKPAKIKRKAPAVTAVPGKKRKLLVVGGATALLGVVLVAGMSMLGGEPSPPQAPSASSQPPAQPVAPAQPTAPAQQTYAPPAQAAAPAPQNYAPPPQPVPPAPPAYAPQPQPVPPAAAAHVPPPQAAPGAPPAYPAPAQPAPAATGADAPQNQARLYYEQGQIFFDAGRLPDAVAAWSRAVALEPGNQMAQVKLQKAKEELTKRAEEAFNRGMRNYQYLNYEQAAQDWLQVLHLLPDPNDPLHRKAKDYMEQARQKLHR